jgi:hypothetical protein
VPLADVNLIVAAASAVAAIVAAGGAIAAAVGSWKLGIRRLEHEREQNDRADGRETLAAGALALAHAKSEMKTALTAYESGLNSNSEWPPYEEFWAQLRKLEAQAEALEAALAAVRIRFDQGAPVVTDMAAAVAHLRSLITVYFLAHGEDDGDDDGQSLAEALALSEQWDKARDDYLAAAQAAVGVQL